MSPHSIFGLLLIVGLIAGAILINKHSSAIFIDQYPVADYGKIQNIWK